MATLQNRRILLGVSGSIAAYKSAELVRALRRAGALIQVVMTPAATQFVTPLTLQTLSGRPVMHQALDPNTEATMPHIDLARWADLILVAPASADLIARLAQGRCDDLLTTLCVASAAPKAVAPAMNQQMWAAETTQANVRALSVLGIHILGPGEGEQACGEMGPGRMLEPEALVEAVAGMFQSGLLEGLRVMVTAGPTREPLDPVRYLSNRSSGRMGYALAVAAADAGAEVTLISGPVSEAVRLLADERISVVDVETAEQMRAAVFAQVAVQDIVVAAAAVADYRPIRAEPKKIKKGTDRVELVLERTADIIAEVSAMEDGPMTVGFAAETDDVLANAKHKLQHKHLDLIAANLVGAAVGGFEREENAVTLIWPDGQVQLPLCSKTELARQIIHHIAERRHAKDTTQNPRQSAR